MHIASSFVALFLLIVRFRCPILALSQTSETAATSSVAEDTMNNARALANERLSFNLWWSNVFKSLERTR